MEQAYGLHPFPRQDYGEVAKDHRDGVPSGVNDVVERIMGRPSLAMLGVFERNRESSVQAGAFRRGPCEGMMSHDLPRVGDCHCFAARRAARRISRFYDDRLQACGLRITQFLILATLDGLGASAVNELAQKLDVERTAMGKMLGLLERDGHVAIRSSPTDGRMRLAELTEVGRDLVGVATPLWLAAQRDFERMGGPDGLGTVRDGSDFEGGGSR